MGRGRGSSIGNVGRTVGDLSLAQNEREFSQIASNLTRPQLMNLLRRVDNVRLARGSVSDREQVLRVLGNNSLRTFRLRLRNEIGRRA